MRLAKFRFVGGYTPDGITYPEKERDGQTIWVEPLDERLYDRANIGDMYFATFPDSRKFQLFADEVEFF